MWTQLTNRMHVHISVFMQHTVLVLTVHGVLCIWPQNLSVNFNQTMQKREKNTSKVITIKVTIHPDTDLIPLASQSEVTQQNTSTHLCFPHLCRWPLKWFQAFPVSWLWLKSDSKGFSLSTVVSLSELNGWTHVPVEEEWGGVVVGSDAGSSLLLSTAFKALTLPPGAFVFCTGTSVTLLLKACIQIAELMHVHRRDKEHYSHSGSCVCTVPTIFYGRRPTLFLSQCASLSVRRAILSSSSDSSCSSTSSHLSPLCLSFSFRSVLELSEWERGNACVLVFVRVAKL